ncbi:MAG: glycosyltransferase [Calditrichota bacterium]
MKLALIGPRPPYRGGISHFNARLTQELEKNHEVLRVNFSRLYPDFLFPGKTQYDSDSNTADSESSRIIDSLNPQSWRRAGRLITANSPDAVIFHWWHPFFGPALRSIISKLSSTIVRIGVCHNVFPHEGHPLWKRLARWTLAAGDGYVLHSRSEVIDISRLGLYKPTLTLFHPIYDIFPGESIPRDEARSRLGIAQDIKMALYFGLIRPYKGVDVLLKALQKLQDITQLKCFIVGEIYAERDRLQELVRKLPPGMVELVDRYIPDAEVALWFRAADVVALPYKSATQSGVIPIAYRCGRPVIATRVGGLPDAVQEEITGWLVEPNDPHGLAQALRHFWGSSKTEDYEANIARFRALRSWERYAADLVEFIKRLNAEK